MSLIAFLRLSASAAEVCGAPTIACALCSWLDFDCKFLVGTYNLPSFMCLLGLSIVKSFVECSLVRYNNFCFSVCSTVVFRRLRVAWMMLCSLLVNNSTCWRCLPPTCLAIDAGGLSPAFPALARCLADAWIRCAFDTPFNDF